MGNSNFCYSGRSRNPNWHDGRVINTPRCEYDLDDPVFRNKNGEMIDVNGNLCVPKGACVYLNVYHLTLANLSMEQYGFGIFHTGVEVYNEEYSFVGGPDTFHSILKTRPYDTTWMNNGKFQETLFVGRTMCTKSELHTLRSQWSKAQPCSSYDLLLNNCNHFSEAFIRVITNNPDYVIPEKITRLVEIGQRVRCCLPDSLVDPIPPHVHHTAEHRAREILRNQSLTSPTSSVFGNDENFTDRSSLISKA